MYAVVMPLESLESEIYWNEPVYPGHYYSLAHTRCVRPPVQACQIWHSSMLAIRPVLSQYDTNWSIFYFQSNYFCVFQSKSKVPTPYRASALSSYHRAPDPSLQAIFKLRPHSAFPIVQAVNLTCKGTRRRANREVAILYNPLSHLASLCSPPVFFLPPSHPSFLFVFFFVFFSQVVDYHFVRWFHRVGERVS